MKTRALVTGLIAAAGLAASANAQSTTTGSAVTCTVQYMGDTSLYAGGTVSDHDGIVEPGEGALLRINISYTGRNTTATFGPGGTGNVGTIRGLGGGFIDLIGSGGTLGAFDNSFVYGSGTDANGDPENWTYGPSNSFSPTQHPDVVGNFAVGNYWGVPNGNGVGLGPNFINAQFGQLPPSATSINAAGPSIIGIFSLVWAPIDYSARNVSFNGQASLAAGAFPFSVLFRNAANQAVSAFTVSNTFVGSGPISVAPTPSSLALLGLGALVIGRRRR